MSSTNQNYNIDYISFPVKETTAELQSDDMPVPVIKVPKFSLRPDEDYVEWMREFKVAIQVCGWTASQKLRAFKMLLGGTAQQIMLEDNPSTYDQLNLLIKNHALGPYSLQIALEKLQTLIQGSDSIQNYQDKLGKLIYRVNTIEESPINQIGENQKLAYFMKGLKNSIKRDVMKHNPETFMDASSYAKLVEAADLSTKNVHDNEKTPYSNSKYCRIHK